MNTICKRIQKQSQITLRAVREAWNFIKRETTAQLFSSEFCEIFKNTSSIEHLWWLPLGLRIEVES